MGHTGREDGTSEVCTLHSEAHRKEPQIRQGQGKGFRDQKEEVKSRKTVRKRGF